MKLGTSRGVANQTEHPFLGAMDTALAFNSKMSSSPMRTKMNRPLMASGAAAREAMWAYVDKIVADRQSGRVRSERQDLLDLMLTTPDPQTGKMMSAELIRQQLITFFIAGHDSTSSMLTSVIYYLTQYPEVEARVAAEVTSVLGGGDDEPSYEDIKKLHYTMQVMQEALRVNPPAGGFVKTALKDTVVGRYFCPKGTKVLTSVRSLHTNPATWGPDPESFDPDRFAPDAAAARHPYAWLPFSSGARACIGMQLSLTEGRVALAMILRRFTFRLHPSANVVLDHSRVFAKLRDVIVTVHPRSVSTTALPRLLRAPSTTSKLPNIPPAVPVKVEGESRVNHGTALRVLYGSNMGTCKAVAAGLAEQGATLGFDVTNPASLDSAIATGDTAKAGELLTADGSGLLAIVTSTYNGTPPDNARAFLKWVQAQPAGALSGLRFALLGVGSSNWKTYQVFPRQLFAALEAAGALAFFNIGEADEEEDFEAATSAWSTAMWRAALITCGQAVNNDSVDDVTTTSSAVVAGAGMATLTVSPAPSTDLPVVASPHDSARLGTVLAVRELQAEGSDRATRHVEIALPKGMTYQHGDHLAVLPANSPAMVLEVSRALGTAPHEIVVLEATGSSAVAFSHLPLGVPITVGQLLGCHVDLGAPLSDAFLRAAIAATECPPERAALEALLAGRRRRVGDDSKGNSGAAEGGIVVAPPSPRLAELLAAFRSVRMGLQDTLPLLPPLRQRYYSISSAPVGPAGPTVATVTVALVEGGATETTRRPFRGVASGFLHDASPGDTVRVFVAPNDRFRLPASPDAPLIMIGPGTGLAPFRGFIQEMAAEGAAGQRRPAALFFGCRSESDFIYRDELTAALREGVLEMMEVGYSRAPGGAKTYVQDKLWEQRATVWGMLQAGGHVYVCGDARRMAKDVDATLIRIAREEGGMSVEGAAEYVACLSSDNRYLQDVWAN
jgi:cytochrome P450/NADPH-cytochrome P450 reductase